jgi:hypothetical protein
LLPIERKEDVDHRDKPGDDENRHTTAIPRRRRCARVARKSVSLETEGAGKAESRARDAPAASRVVKNTRVSRHRFAGNAQPSLRNGFNGFLRALLGEPGLLSPSQATMRKHRGQLDASSGRQDHTTIFWYSVKHAETKKTL